MRETPRPRGKNVQPRRLTVLISEYSLKPITDISLRSEKPVKSKFLDDFEKIRNFVQRLLLRVSCEFDSRRGCQIIKSRSSFNMMCGFILLQFVASPIR